ncbi:MAG: citrate transporter, partial [Sulfuritalea sp.]|nr:citrate transporter [Sulfuritalea sp.]
MEASHRRNNSLPLACRVLALAGLLLAASVAQAADGAATSPALFGIPVDFILFAATLVGVALFHHYVLQVALTGLVTITAYKVMFTGFKTGAGLAGFSVHMAHEWVLLANLLGLLVGFALLARHFEDSGVPEVLPRLLPEGWLGPFMLLVIIFVLSGFLDNIAAALIGATVAASVFKRKVHIGYLAAIVAASNGGGAGSVVGDTTTTMMWLDGVSPLDVVEAYIPAAVALVVFGIPAALLQHKHMAISRDFQAAHHIDWARVGIVIFILVGAIITNVTVNLKFAAAAEHFPFLGAAVWVALLLAVPLRKPEWS